MSGKPWHIHHGDVRRVAKTLDAASFDAVLCDPPYGLRFMGRRWDYSVPSPMVWVEVERLLKPGAYGMIFGGSRTFHRLLVAVEDGGFEIRDVLHWLYGEGMPKSLDVAKAIDKKLGAARPVVGTRTLTGTAAMSAKEKGGTYTAGNDSRGRSKEVDITAEATDEAKRWKGYGTGLKPSYEPVALVRRFPDGTVADTAMEHGVGGINIDGSRIGTIEARPLIQSGTKTAPASEGWGGLGQGSRYAGTTTQGRWPGNVILVHTDECEPVEGKTTGCAPHCPARMLDAQSGERPGGGAVRTPNQGFSSGRSMFGSGEHKGGVQAFGGYQDSGGASRFFYTAKADGYQRNAGTVVDEEGGNDHPTVKPLDLIRYLAGLILPPKRDTPRRILVPFSGSGSEMIGCIQAGWDEVVGIEREAHYIEIAKARITQGGVLSGLADKKLRRSKSIPTRRRPPTS